MPELHARDGADDVDKVLADFDKQIGHFNDLCERTKDLITQILEHEKRPIHSVQGRVKRREKLKAKYSSADKDYKSLSDMPDVVGLRVITYHSDEIDRVAEILRPEFAVIREDDKRTGKPGEFGYSALHIDARYSSSRLQQREYKRFGSMRFEIQISTILGHAWAEMNHAPYDDKSSSPPHEQRAFHRLAAVLELADKEFLEIRKDREERERVASVRVASMAPETRITPDSLWAFVMESPTARTLDARLAQILGQELRADLPMLSIQRLTELTEEAGYRTIQDLEENLKAAEAALPKYVALCSSLWEVARPPIAPSVVVKGLSIFHLCSILLALDGKEAFIAHMANVHRTPNPRVNLDEQLRIAKEVASTFGLKRPH